MMTATDDIEERAVDQVSDFFKYNFAETKAQISQGDRAVSFDGKIVLFTSKERTKDEYQSSIPVQVKGTEVTSYSGSTAKFSRFEKSEFENFQREDGVLVFLVELMKGDRRRESKKIFWSFLDVEALEKILCDMQSSGAKTQSIRLDEIQAPEEFILELRKIAVRRKVMSYGLVKYNHSFLTMGDKSDEFELGVVEGIRKQISTSEFINPESQFNIALRQDCEYIFSRLPQVDSVRVSVIMNKLNIVSESGAILSRELQRFASGIQIIYGILGNDMKGVKVEAQRLIESRADFKWIDLLVYWADKLFDFNLSTRDIRPEVKALIDANCSITRSDDKQFTDIYAKFNDNSAIWKQLYADYLSTADPKTAIKQYQESFRASENFQTRIKSFALRWSIILSEGPSRSIEEMDMLLVEINSLQQNLQSLFHSESQDIRRIQFELQAFIDPKNSVKRVSKLISESQDDDRKYLLGLKLQLLWELGKNDDVIDQLNTFGNDVMTIRIALIVLDIHASRSDCFAIYQFIRHVGESEIEPVQKRSMISLGVQVYCDTLSSMRSSASEEQYHFLINELDHDQLDVPALIKLYAIFYSVEKKGEFLSRLKDEIVSHLAEKTRITDVFELWRVLPTINSIQLTDVVYPYMYALSPQKAMQVIAVVLVNNREFEKAKWFADELSLEDNSFFVLQMKAQIYSGLKEYRSLIKLYFEHPQGNTEYMYYVLVAFNKLHDTVNATNLAKKLVISNNREIRINAALTLIENREDVAASVQLLEKEVLSSAFTDDQINSAFVMSVLGLGDKDQSTKEADIENGWELKHLVLSKSNSKRNVIFAPEKWNISNFSDIEVLDPTSELGMAAAGLSVGETIRTIRSGEEETIITSEPLSLYILHETLKRESGGLDSDKPMKAIKVDDDLSGLFQAMKRFDNSKQITLAFKKVSEFNSFMPLSAVLRPEDIMKAISLLFDDKSIRYVVGTEAIYDKDNRYVLSLSSILFLDWLGLMPLVSKFRNVFVAEGMVTWLQSLIKQELHSNTSGRLALVDGKMRFIEENAETRRPLIERYKRMLSLIASMPQLSVGAVNPKISTIERLDAESVQLAIDQGAVLLTEDSAWQYIVQGEFSAPAGVSVMTLIAQAWLADKNEYQKYFDVLQKAFAKHTGWSISSLSTKFLTTKIDSDSFNRIMNLAKSL